jgi:glycosyltransferase involved in cell wall biosynthesis
MSRSTRIALVSWCGSIGGAETQTHLIAREFRKQGINASIVFIEHGGLITPRLDEDAIPWYELGLTRGSTALIRPRRLLKTLSVLGRDGVILPHVGFLIAILRAGGYRAPIIGVDHGSLLQLTSLSIGRKMRLYATRATASGLRYDHVAVSQAMYDEVLSRGMRSRCSLIYNGVEIPTSCTPPTLASGEYLIVGAASRLTAGKGLEFAIRALVDQPARLRIAGEGPDRSRLEMIAREAEVHTRVEFLGWVHDLGTFWRGCHVGIVPSTHSESFGLAAVEAMAAGRPVIASRQPALTEVIGTSGLLVPQGDSLAIARAIGRLRGESGLIDDLAVRARTRTEQLFDIRVTANAYRRLLNVADQ